MFLRHRLSSRFFGWLAYSLSRSERRDTPSSAWHPFEFDQTHNLIAFGSYNLGDGWQLGARFRYGSGRPIARRRVLYDTQRGEYVALSDIPLDARLPDFHQLDIRIEKRWNKHWGIIAFYLEVLNVYNQNNSEVWSQSSDLTEQKPAGYYLPIFPNLGLRGEL